MGELSRDLIVGAAAVGVGYYILKNFPNILSNTAGDIFGSFAEQSYNLGFKAGEAADEALKNPWQKAAETGAYDIELPSNINTMTPAQASDAWEAEYQQIVNPFGSLVSTIPLVGPILSGGADVWHKFLTGEALW